MESKLQSLKVAELKSLLTTAGLAVSGNKPDLIQRLLENPSATSSLGGGEAVALSAPVTAPVETVSTPTIPPPSPSPATASASAPAATQVSSATAEEGSSEETRRQALIVELEKRKARAAKFGIPLGEAEHKLERAIKFGLDPNEEANVAKLTQPLGSKPPKSDKKQQSAKEKDQNPETEQEKLARLQELEKEKAKARKRAERFGIAVDDEGKRKRTENGSAAEKKVKT